MFCAHINKNTLKQQSVYEHLINVSELAKEYGEKISLSATAELAGLLHDMGKQTNKFNSYIHYNSNNPNDKSRKGTIDHSTAGARYIYYNFYNTKDPYLRTIAQIISLVICSHHGGLIDSLNLEGINRFSERMERDNELYEEALYNFMSEYSDSNNVITLMEKSKGEFKQIMSKIDKIDSSAKSRQFTAGMLAKYIFSCVIDADRYDTYLFMEDKKPNEKTDIKVLWQELSDVLEGKISYYPKSSKIDRLRGEISLSCKQFGEKSPGIYQLSVPTGGGKTLSSLRYALEHAKIFEKDRIVYIIPFTTIIDQNAKEIKDILGRDDIILEHHSNLVQDNENEDYKLLTERWDSPIILSTMVQFLETLFSGGTQGIRRMHNLANAIIIFDEIQAIPIKCISMFNSAMNFLTNICNATIILCTATQPLLSTTEMPLQISKDANIVPNIEEKFMHFKRVNLVDKRINGGYSAALVKEFVLDKMEQVRSVLVILNTKSAAREIFRELKEANSYLPTEKQYAIFHLSTNMCPKHRMSILKAVKDKLGHERVICVSTQLIEAGINISFECVVRSLAGLDSIAQAAGRCNRHGERACSDVYIINVAGENVDKLIDIKKGQEATERVLDEFKDNPKAFDDELLSPKVMDSYYRYYFHERRKEMNYTLPKPHNDKSMYDLLASNKEAVIAYKGRSTSEPKLMLRQAFKTAGDYFNVIDQNTTSVLVPYKKGKSLITLLNGRCSLSESMEYLKEAQQFSVNLFDIDKKRLEEKGGIYSLNHVGVLALREEFYNEAEGVSFEGGPMAFYDY